MAIHQDVGDRVGLLRSNVWLGHAKMHLGQYQEARAYGQTALELAQEIDPGFETTLALFVLGGSALGLNDDARAQQLLQKSVAIYQKIGGRRAHAWPLALLGYANLRLNQLVQARQRLIQTLRTVAEGETYITRTFALPAVGLLLAKQGKTVYAVEIYALASRYPFVANSRWFQDVVGKHIAAETATLPPDVVAAAQERGQARDLEATVAELLAELEERQGSDAP
jgi:tetratricopeptide (TPR) repeat protein